MGTDIKKDTILFIALDTHKKFHHVAYVEDGRGNEVVDYGQIKGSKIALTQRNHKLGTAYAVGSAALCMRCGWYTLDCITVPLRILFI
jgi:hypothetical protein